MTTENITTEKIIAEAPDKGVGCRVLLGVWEALEKPKIGTQK